MLYDLTSTMQSVSDALKSSYSSLCSLNVKLWYPNIRITFWAIRDHRFHSSSWPLLEFCYGNCVTVAKSNNDALEKDKAKLELMG